MFVNHKGISIVEWLVLAAVVVVIVGGSAIGIAQSMSAQGTSFSEWISSFSVGS